MLAVAVCQSLNWVTDPPPSRASPLPHLRCVPRLVWGCTTRSNAAAAPRPPARTPIKTVGAGLLAKAACQSLKRVTDPPPSRASPLPHLACVPRLESGCTTRSNAGAASRPPAPTPINTVGAGLLAKAVCQSLKRVADQPPSRASPLPHSACIPRLESGCTTGSNAAAAPRPPARTPIKTVGAGLPAKAVCQSLKRVADQPPSRASPLPHLGCIPRLEPSCTVCSNAGEHLESQAQQQSKLWERACPRKRCASR